LYLKHFRPDEILISADDANTILRFFFGSQVSPSGELTGEDIAFAQALLLEAIDKSYVMGYVQIVFDSFYMKVPGSFDSVEDIAKDFAKKAARHWFDHATGKDLANPKIYESIRRVIIVNFRSVWVIRMQGGGLTY
jgi:hypothetical protein